MLKAVVDVNLLSFINFAVLFSSDTDEQAQQAFDFQLIKTAGSQNCHQTGKTSTGAAVHIHVWKVVTSFTQITLTPRKLSS